MSLNISLHGYSLWGLFKRLLLLGCILINKWGLRPNIRVQAFAPPQRLSLGIRINKNPWTLLLLSLLLGERPCLVSLLEFLLSRVAKPTYKPFFFLLVSFTRIRLELDWTMMNFLLFDLFPLPI